MSSTWQDEDAVIPVRADQRSNSFARGLNALAGLCADLRRQRLLVRVFWLPLLRIRWAGPSDGLAALSRQLRDVVPTLSNVESALEVLRRRIDEARARASKIVCDGVRQKHQRRRLTSKITRWWTPMACL